MFNRLSTFLIVAIFAVGGCASNSETGGAENQLQETAQALEEAEAGVVLGKMIAACYSLPSAFDRWLAEDLVPSEAANADFPAAEAALKAFETELYEQLELSSENENVRFLFEIGADEPVMSRYRSALGDIRADLESNYNWNRSQEFWPEFWPSLANESWLDGLTAVCDELS